MWQGVSLWNYIFSKYNNKYQENSSLYLKLDLAFDLEFFNSYIFLNWVLWAWRELKPLFASEPPASSSKNVYLPKFKKLCGFMYHFWQHIAQNKHIGCPRHLKLFPLTICLLIEVTCRAGMASGLKGWWIILVFIRINPSPIHPTLGGQNWIYT